MKKVYTKIPAMIAMLISVVTAALVLASIVYALKGGDAYIGFLVGIGLYYIEIIIYFFYFIDAILSIVKAIKKIQPIFNSILAFLIVGTIPMVLWALSAKRMYIGLVCVYYFAIFVLEVISIVKHIKIMRECKKNKENQGFRPVTF